MYTLILIIVLCLGARALSDEKRLIKQLLDFYDKAGKIGRPVKNQGEMMKVQYGIALIQIMDLDEKNQILTTNVWCNYGWTDTLLSWAPNDYENVSQVRIPIDSIWKPDLRLYNYADERLMEHRDAMAVVYDGGNINWIPPAIFKSTCPIDTTNFPFDEQKCRMKFGSWTYNGKHLDLEFYDNKEYITLENYLASQEWIILEHNAQKNIITYECCPNEPYVDLTFYLRLRRKAAFYNYILILPCVLLSTITMVLFMLPPESPAKMQLGINIFVAFFLLLLLLKDTTPPASSKIPLIGAYYCFNMIMTTISTFLCAIVVDLHFRADKRSPPPKWLKKIMIVWLARALCMRVPPSKKTQAAIAASRAAAAAAAEGKPLECVSIPGEQRRSVEMKYNKFQMYEYSADGGGGRSGVENDEEVWQRRRHSPQNAILATAGTTNLPNHMADETGGCLGSPTADKSPIHLPSSAEADIREIRKAIKTYVGRITTKESIVRSAQDWRVITMVLDRLFFYLYIICMIISLTTLFPENDTKERENE